MRIAAIVTLVLLTAATPAAARARQANTGHTGFSIELRLGTGVKYDVVTYQNSCADDIEFPAGTTAADKQTVTLGFNPSNSIGDGCFLAASWVRYQINITAPWSGSVRFFYGNGQAGGDYWAQCTRDTESGVWCHRTGTASIVIGKLN